MRCPACRHEITEASRFCPACGKAVEVSSAPTVTSVPSSPAEREGNVSVTPTTRTTHTIGRILHGDSGGGARFQPGDLLAERYRIIGLIGRGGMGEVYRADDLKLDQPVALKFLPAAVEQDPTRLNRFMNEVRVARQVSHPNVCRVYDIGEIEGRHFLSMEYVDGEDLATLLRRIGRLPGDKAIQIARQICAGLAAAHNRGIVHRDLKPANVMIDGDGQVRLTDFGLAGLAAGIQGPEIRAGTPDYMAPEQIEGREVTIRSDLYSLGHVLYELFTGKPAFRASSLGELRRMQTEATPTRPSTVVDEIHPAVERIILNCLEKDPAMRPASALAVAAALPGGDPLSAALEAGETPSPEIVADAQVSEGLRPAVALSCLVAFFAGLVLLLGLSGRVLLVERIGLDKPPEALVVEARAMLARLGHSAAPADEAFGFVSDGAYLEHVLATDPSSSRWDDIRNVRPAPLQFWYRQSPAPLTAVRLAGDVSDHNPPQTLSGMANVRVDPQGRLLAMLVVPPQFDEGTADGAEPDWTALLREAGLDPASLQSVDPQWNPLVDCDRRAAWEGAFPGQPDVPVRVEAGAWRGLPVYFQVIAPWTRPSRMQPARPGAGERAANVVLIVLLLVITIGGLLLARQNLRAGRGDRRGAIRMAIYVFCIILASWALGSHHVAGGREVGLLFISGIQSALLVSVIVWFVYLALEPYVRRLWPHVLISWTRLLAGRITDPLLGRDVLMGGLAGVGVALMMMLGVIVPSWLGLAPAPPFDTLTEPLTGTRQALGALIGIQASSILSPIGLLFLILLLRILLRRKALAIGGAFLMIAALSALQNRATPLGVVFYIAVWVLIMFVTIRLGLLAAILAVFFANSLLMLPLTSDLSAWYAGRTLFLLALLCAVVTAGFYVSLAGRQILGVPLLQGSHQA